MHKITQQQLDKLTRVDFVKSFTHARVDEVLSVGDLAIPVYRCQAVVAGSGAAGLRAAVELQRRNVQVLLVSAGLYTGTSACSGSDKQTLFTAASGKNGDDFVALAQALGAGGGMDLDLAYVEAVGSIHTLAGLQYLGLELPQDRYGAVLRYQTDHDATGRATSCGPRTSRLMVSVLLDEVQRLAIPLLRGASALRLLRRRTPQGQWCCAGLIVSTNSAQYNAYRLGIIDTSQVVLATGGPGDMYRDSVYPKKCYGSLGLALEAGMSLTNVMESQFGIGTPRTHFPWNLSGTYTQVMPCIYSLDDRGMEQHFLADYYRNTHELASAIFRKGYQWPFHASRTLNYGSSLIDMAVAKQIHLGHKVYMDFSRNPCGLAGDAAFTLAGLEKEAQDYLRNNDCADKLPIQRLQRMNPLAIELYKMHGHDLQQEPLEFAVNNQHMNGGIAVDIWGESDLAGCFATGEVAGTHGVTRPGGAALNSGQVFAIRAANKISRVLQLADPVHNQPADYVADIRHIVEFTRRSLQGDGTPLAQIKHDIRQRMSDEAGFIVRANDIHHSAFAACQLLHEVLHKGIKIDHYAQIAELMLWRHFALTSAAVLTMLDKYTGAGGGSRGARIILDDKGDALPCGRDGAIAAWRFRRERHADRENKYFIRWDGADFHHYQRPVIQHKDFYSGSFEKQWIDYLTGVIYNPE